MVSPGNTLICLTQDSPSCDPEEPDSFYPSGTRNYARVVPNDAFQGAGLAQFAAGPGRRPAPTCCSPPRTRPAAGRPTPSSAPPRSWGWTVSGLDIWDPEAADYEDLMERVGRGRRPTRWCSPGCWTQNGAQADPGQGRRARRQRERRAARLRRLRPAGDDRRRRPGRGRDVRQRVPGRRPAASRARPRSWSARSSPIWAASRSSSSPPTPARRPTCC